MQCNRIRLKTGVELNVATAGERASRAVILLHGFPESRRTWRGVAPRLAPHFFVVAPDQRGFAESDRPHDSDAYLTDKLVDDVFALADALGVEQFAVVGHDWGGIIAWEAALRVDPRLERLAIINAPHPVIYQRSLINDAEQRLAAQYVTQFRSPGFSEFVAAQGYDWFFDATLAPNVDMTKLTAADRAQYIEDWSRPGAFDAMLNWYRAAKYTVPAPDEEAEIPDWASGPCRKIEIPTLAIWGMKDFALKPVQLEGLDEAATDLQIVRLQGCGHFATWEAPEDVASALIQFLKSG